MYKGFRHYRHLAAFHSNFGGITMAFTAEKHVQDLAADDKVVVAFSFCSGTDNFQRRTGRKFAEQRLDTAPLTVSGQDFLNLLHAPDINTLAGCPKAGVGGVATGEIAQVMRKYARATY